MIAKDRLCQGRKVKEFKMTKKIPGCPPWKTSELSDSSFIISELVFNSEMCK